MSENSDSGSSSDDVRQTTIANGASSDDNVCRDFLRNVCRRGKRCKFRHPSSENGVDVGAMSKPEPTFCHDFQNTGCHRPTCKFLHCTREEEEHYHQTGQLPHRLQQQQQQQQQQPTQPGMGGNATGNHSDIPVCRDYMKGECKRGIKCKYRHLGSNNDYDCDISRGDSHHHPSHPPPMRQQHHPSDVRNNHNNYNSFDDGYEKYERYEYGPGGGQGQGPCHDGPGAGVKRRRLDVDGYGGGGGGYEGRFGPGPAPVRPVSYQYQVLEEENAALRRRVEELKKQVADLTATNEVLLEQNARLRVAKTTAVSTVHVPVSQTLPPAVTLGLTGMGQPATLQATTLGAHLNPSLTQQIALNSDMATQHALQSAAQRMAREIQQQQQQQAAAAAAVAAATPSRPQPGPPPTLGGPTLNPNVTMNPPLGSLSMPQNNMVAVSLPSLVSPAPLQQVGVSMAQNLGTPSNPLVSYPIMSQDMRCAVAPSSMTH